MQKINHDHNTVFTESEKTGISCSCEEGLLKEKEPLWKRKPLEIIVVSAVLISAGLYFDFFTDHFILAELLFLAVVAVSGSEIIKKGLLTVLKGKFNMNFLITLAVAGAFMIGAGAEGASVIFLFFVAEFLEEYAGERARNSISELLKLAPEKAIIIKDGAPNEVPVNSVNVGDIFIVKPGDKIPLDGVIVTGTSSVNQAPITGESLPITRTEGDTVFAGTLNEEGYLEVHVVKKSDETVLSKIVQLVKDSEQKKSKTEIFIDKFAGYYTPTVIGIAALVAVVPSLVFGLPFNEWFYKALVLLVVSCPCALAISTPVSMVSGITAATKKGVLIKGGEYIEEIKNSKAFVFDKTGTLTEGILEVTDVITLKNYSKYEVMQIAGSLESKSKHPLAEAINKYLKNLNIEFRDVSKFKSTPGIGVQGKIGDKLLFTGNKSLFKNFSEFPSKKISELEESGKTIVMVGDNKSIIGIIALMDKIRENSKTTVQELKDNGIKTVMLTGDNNGTAKSVAKIIGIDEYYADLLPEDKVKQLDNLMENYGHVSMVGDGVNDAPALARASTGIAMGAAGSDIAIETADIALMHDDISKVNYLIKLSKKTMSVVKENVAVSLIIKGSFAVFAILGFVTLWMAVAIGDMGLSLLVILNALRIGAGK